jgi:hypothetical protein
MTCWSLSKHLMSLIDKPWGGRGKNCTSLISMATFKCSLYGPGSTMNPQPRDKLTSSSGRFIFSCSAEKLPSKTNPREYFHLPWSWKWALQICKKMAYSSGSSAQSSGKFIPGWGQVAQNNASSPGCTFLESCPKPNCMRFCMFRHILVTRINSR